MTFFGIVAVLSSFGPHRPSDTNLNFGSPGIVDGRFHVNDLDSVYDEADITFYDLQEGRYGSGKVCPGTGVACIIPLAPDPDGDPVYLYSYKQKGKPNIEITSY